MYIKNAAEIKKVREVAEQMKNQAEANGKENEKLCSEIKTLVQEKNNEKPQQKSYASALKMSVKKNVARDVPVLKNGYRNTEE